ncbi:chromatin assembly factor 1 subunit FAS1-like [Telopea speciosissima]|uniref:chromatin assembly factor 1 subunit FAS1-like n=1 Tax=Telopea speciosissima TaxID=54955 RepID=UPI001CC4B82A|nr:chromatin assembly factor 1 subunit FAS1-like [Telopea speciosissima]
MFNATAFPMYYILLVDKDFKWLQDEAEKEERCREREEAEMKNQLKRQQEEAEKNQRRREKEEAELKKQIAIQKQASMMERFLKSKKNNSRSQHEKSSTKATSSDSSRKNDEIFNAVTLSMDTVLSLKDGMSTDELFKSHQSSWRQLGHASHSNRLQHWGIRRTPKTVLVKELKLTSNKEVECDDQLDKLVNGWEETVSCDRSGHNNADVPLTDIWKHNRAKQLLQFDKSFRPAFYGIRPKRSPAVGPRHPFMKDPGLDYDIDSDEEWEEEEPGESILDCDNDDEEESVEEWNQTSNDKDGSDNGFLVPDGYLSENEGVQLDRMEFDMVDDEAISSPSCKQDSESEEVRAFLRLKQYLHNLTENALRKNKPLIISNLMHEKSTLLVTEGIYDSSKLEVICLHALRMEAFPGGPPIEISKDKLGIDDDVSATQSKNTI